MGAIVITGLTVKYGAETTAVSNLDIEIRDGEFFALLGPSGCGKTTLLRTIAGLIRPFAGTINISGRDVSHVSAGGRDLAMVFQDYALYPHMSVIDNIAYPLKLRRQSKRERYTVAREAAASLGLTNLLDQKPGQLSGGQQQRTALGRAIVCRPSAFLFDEPLSNLDARLRLEARTFLKRLQKRLAVTTVYVTHDQAEALAMADRMAVMEKGVIRQVGAPEDVFRRPANVFVAKFIGATPMNLLAARIESGHVKAAGATIALPNSVRAESDMAEVTLAMRPEYIRIVEKGSGNSAIHASVSLTESLGTHYLVTADAEDCSIQLVVTEDDVPTVGSEVWLAPDADRMLVYGADGELLGPSRQRELDTMQSH